MRARIRDEILKTYLADTVKARVMGTDGVYRRRRASGGQARSSQDILMRDAARDRDKSDRE